MKQITRRILNIAAFQKETKRGKARGFLIYILIAFLSLSYAPVLAAAGSPQNEYRLPNDMKNISTIDLSNHFNGYQAVSFYMIQIKTPGIFLTSKCQRTNRPKLLLTRYTMPYSV